MGKRATIYTVADHAGVSIASGSRVDRGDPAVAVATATRVQASMRTVGYRPNGAERLVGSRNEPVSTVLPSEIVIRSSCGCRSQGGSWET